MKTRLFIAAAMVLTVISSCTKLRLRGDGAIVSETRNVSSFTSIDVDGDVDVEVYQSNENKVILTAYQNLIPVYETKVKGNTLKLGFRDGYWNVRNNNMRVEVYTTDVNSVNLNGSGDVRVGSSIASQDFNARINGSGSIVVDNNHFENVNFKVNGSGDIDAKKAVCKNVYADISGSGSIDVNVTNMLTVKISGSGNVNYWGDPVTVNTDISGSGKVRKH